MMWSSSNFMFLQCFMFKGARGRGTVCNVCQDHARPRGPLFLSPSLSLAVADILSPLPCLCEPPHGVQESLPLGPKSRQLSGTESAILTLSRESGDSESCDLNRAIPKSRLNTDRLRFGLAILNRFSTSLLYCNSTQFVLLSAEILRIIFPPQPLSLLICFLNLGRKEKFGKKSSKGVKVLEIANFQSRPGCRQKSLLRNSGVGVQI